MARASARGWVALALVAAAGACGSPTTSQSAPRAAVLPDSPTAAQVKQAVTAAGGHLCPPASAPPAADAVTYALSSTAACTAAGEAGQGLLVVRRYPTEAGATTYLDAVRSEAQAGGAATAREVGWQDGRSAVVLLGSPSAASVRAVADALAGRGSVAFGVP